MAFRRGNVAQAFRNNRQLQRFVLTDVTPTGRILGTGSYGSVEEVKYKHLICAGKVLHEILLNMENEGIPEMVDKYLQECQLMSSLHHPNITQFLGLCFLPGTQLPLLVMEQLETSLDDLLEHMPNLPLSLKRSVLEDVASGLLYLHEKNPPVIHRNLTSKNVLLTSSLVAKITDMGNSRIIPGQMARTLSKLPGTLVYMPPEARDERHHYGPSLDIFSFGHLALFTITQKFPSDLLPSIYTNPDNADEVRRRTELQCREKYIDLLEAEINSKHPSLVELVKQCLHNDPHQRPTTDDVLARLQRMREEVEVECGGGVVKLDLSKMKSLKELKIKDRRMEEQQERHEAELEEKTRELEEKTRELEGKMRELEEITRELDGMTQGLQVKDRRVQELQGKIQTLSELMAMEIVTKDQEIALHRGRNQQLRNEIEGLHADMQLGNTRLREELQSKEAEISRLREELSKCQGQLQEGAKASLLQLRWRRGPDMPFEMTNTIQSVLVKETVYIGGGCSADNDYVVMAYNTSSGKWAKLSPYLNHYFTMTVLNDQLVLVGGGNSKSFGNNNKVLGVWRAEWTHPYPDMLTARHCCSAVVHKHWLVVAGGWGDGGRYLSSVEVMNTDTKQWYTGPPTPRAWSEMKTAVVGDVCYYMGGFNPHATEVVYSVSLPALVSQLTTDSPSVIWKEISGLQTIFSSPLSISGSLFAVGGRDKDRYAVTAIYLYQPDIEEWVKVEDLPIARYQHSCTITGKELIVAGGFTVGGSTNTVDIAQIQF